MARRRSSRTVEIGRLAVTDVDGVCRVTAQVAGVPVWFETRDAALRAAPEAMASAFLIPALHQGARLDLHDAPDPEWLANVARLLPILHDWWRYPILLPAAPATAVAPVAVLGHDASALFFSGGLDSFHALLEGGEHPAMLVTLHGFDVALDDLERMAALEASLREVGAALGRRTVLVRTNVREHPLMRGAPWERTHGGALAAVGHLLGGEVREALIAASISTLHAGPWGSHWRTDALFSSGRLRVRQVGMDRRRWQKVRAIAGEPLAQRHLRVCWQNRDAAANCSRCDKCLVTRLMLADCGALDRFARFDGTATLARDLDALPALHERVGSLAAIVDQRRIDPEIWRAAHALLQRTRRAQQPDVRLRRAVLRTLLEWTGRA